MCWEILTDIAWYINRRLRACLKLIYIEQIRIGSHYCSQLKDNVDDNDENDNMLFDHNVSIEIIIYNSLENLIINWSGD